MAEVDFSDVDQATAWFEKQTVETRCAMSCRAALRVLANFRADLGGAPDNLDLYVFRAVVTSAGRGSGRPADVVWDRAARSAGSAASSAAGSAAGSAAHSAFSAFSARSAAHSAFSAFSARSAADSAADSAASSAAHSAAHSAANSAIGWDAEHIGSLFEEGVWAGAEVPDAIAANHAALLDLLADKPAWAFWRRFYEGMWNGTFDDWDLALEVIKIPEEDWEKGYVHIGELIAGIEARLLAGKARINEQLVLNDQTLLYTAETVSASNPERLARHLSRVEDALDDIIALGGGNGLTANTAEYRILTRLIRKYSTDPERVAFDLTDVNKSITRQIEVGEYANDEPIKLLQAAHTACVSFICEAHPEIEEELNRGLEPTEVVLSEQDILILDEAMRVSETS